MDGVSCGPVLTLWPRAARANARIGALASSRYMRHFEAVNEHWSARPPVRNAGTLVARPRVLTHRGHGSLVSKVLPSRTGAASVKGLEVTDHGHLVRSDSRGAVAWLTIDSHANRNALGGPVLAGLLSALQSSLEDPDVRVVVITSTGDVFSSGADLRDTTDSGVIEQAYRDLFGGIMNAAKPVVARLNGHCFGGAIGLAAVCDLSVTVDDALFAFTEVRLGRTATLASVVSLPRLRVADAAELLLRGNRIDGARAAALGLVNKSVPRAQLDTEVDAVLSDLLAGGPQALANTKLLLRAVPQISSTEAWDLAFRITRETAGSSEAEEGSAAFREGRDPSWKLP
jgi:methylglutaconyl-CoA hydratase